MSIKLINLYLTCGDLKCGENKSTKIIHDERGFIIGPQDTKNNKRIL